MNVYQVTVDHEPRLYAAECAAAAIELEFQAYLADCSEEERANEAETRADFELNLFQGVHLVGELENWPEQST